MDLLSGFGKRGVELGLLTKPADVIDTAYLSTTFILQEFSPQLTAGKNSITFNGSDLLKKGSEVQVECIDSAGEPLYIESTTRTSTTYKESSTYVLSVHVYAETSNGPGKLILYGTLATGATVKWVGDVVIDKTKQNSSTVRFYNKPTLEVHPILSYIIAYVGELNRIVDFSGSFYGYAVNPEKDTLKTNKRNIDVDYRIYAKQISDNSDSTASFNNQQIDSQIDLHIKTIQEPYSYRNLNTYYTSSLRVKKVINNSTIILSDVITYPDSKKNDVITNVVDGDFFISYPYMTYNTASESSSYLVANTSAGNVFVQQSYADIIYRNLRTFSGFIARHKLYRKSLFSPGDFEVIADEPLSPYELLIDRPTTNKAFDKMGTFYNQRHVNKYWFPNTSTIQLTHSSARLNESVNINSTLNSNNLNSLSNYIILKDNSSHLDRNSTYYAYNENEFSELSGSSYDSNFIELKKDVNYIISLNAIIKKDNTTLSETDAGLEFYFTSSISDINLELNATKEQNGLLKLGVVSAYEPLQEKIYNQINILFSLAHNLYGTLLIVPRKCTAIISELSLKPYGDFGFSPDTLITRISFPIHVANESFELKSELFDINSKLVYSDLRTISSFDVNGDSLKFHIPGFRDPTKTEFLSGSLEISQSLFVREDASITGSFTVLGPVFLNGIEESLYLNERMLAWNKETGRVSYTNLNDIDPVGTTHINVSLYGKNTDDKILPPFRLIPAVEGKNIFVPVKQLQIPPTTETS